VAGGILSLSISEDRSIVKRSIDVGKLKLLLKIMSDGAST